MSWSGVQGQYSYRIDQDQEGAEVILYRDDEVVDTCWFPGPDGYCQALGVGRHWLATDSERQRV